MQTSRATIEKYNVVSVGSVQDYIDDGWQPHGNPIQIEGSTVLMQAIVKYKQIDMSGPIMLTEDDVLGEVIKENA